MKPERPKPGGRCRRPHLLGLLTAALSAAGGAGATPTPAAAPAPDRVAPDTGDPVARWAALRAQGLAPPASAPPDVLHLTVAAPGLEVAEVDAQVGAPLSRAVAQALPEHRGLDTVARPGQLRLTVAVAPGEAEVAQRALAEVAQRALAEVTRRALAEVTPGPVAATLETLGFRRGVPTAEVARVLAPEADGAAVRQALERLPGVVAVGDCGFEPAGTTVWVDPARLPPSHASLAAVARAIDQAQALRRSDLAELILTVGADGLAVKLAAVATLAPSDETACRCTVAGAAARCVTITHRTDAGPEVDRPAWAAALRPTRPAVNGPRFRLKGALDGPGRAAALAGAVAQAAPTARLEVHGVQWRLEAPAVAGPALADALAGRAGISPELGRVDGEPAVTVWVVGDAAEPRDPVAAQVATALRAAGGRAAVVASPARREWSVQTDGARLAAHGVTVADVAQAVRAAQVGLEVTAFGAPPVRVRWAGPSGGPVDPAAQTPEAEALRLAAVGVAGLQGLRTRVDAVARLVASPEPAARFRRDGQPAQPVSVMGLAPAAVAEALGAVSLPPGVRLEVATSFFELDDSGSN